MYIYIYTYIYISWLVGFYDVSTLVDYSMLNPLFTQL